MPNSLNGWPVVYSSDDLQKTLAGQRMPNGVRRGDVEVVLGYVAEQFHRRVEPLVTGWCWGWNNRAVTGGTAPSNHASATAIDLNAPNHPYGKANTFTPVQRDTIHDILAEVGGGVVRWGGDYTGNRDDMHFEINAGVGAVAAAAARIRAIQPPPPSPEPIRNQEEHHMQVKAGTNVKSYIPCDGKRGLKLAIGGPGRKIQFHAWYIGDTPSHAGGDYLGEVEGTVDSDRPGPIGLPEHVSHVALITTCDEDFTAWCV